MWYKSFEPYLTNLSRVTKIPIDQLTSDFKQLHQKYGTAECSYAYKELGSIKREHYSLIEDESSGPSIIHTYYRDKRNYLKIYDGVHQTLSKIKTIGTKIVGFTESNIFYTKYRIKTLNFDGLYDYIYSTEDHRIPKTVKRYYSENYWDPALTQIRIMPGGSRKPSPDILLNIIKDMGGDRETTIYIGDKPDRDVYMANLAGVTSVYAEYGNIIDTEAYELLRKVTHWSDNDVQREIEFKKGDEKTQRPRFTVQSFAEILSLFEFVKLEGKNDGDKSK